MNDTVDQTFIRMPDPDAPIFRIFSLWFFEALLQQKQLVLVTPDQWEDPFEVLAHNIQMNDTSTRPYTFEELSPYLTPLYAQCWSKTHESDTLLRAYSRVVLDPYLRRNITPRDEGVKVRTSPRKLSNVLARWKKGSITRSFYIGCVRYGTRDQVLQELANLIGNHGPVALGRGHLRAELSLLKRQAYAHEAEVRAICIDGQPASEQPMIRIQVEPNELIEEVEFDPRLITFERKEREAVAKSLGYEGPFGDSGLYQGQDLEVVLPNGWKK
jgi:hypothetical protein